MVFRKIKKYFSNSKQDQRDGKHILIVDGEIKERNYINKALKKRRYPLIHVDDLEEAWAAVKERDPGLVIVGSRVSGESSLDLCIKIKGDPKTKKIPIIAIADSKNDTNIVDYVQNTDGYLIKPINEKELVKQVEALIIKESC